MPLPFSGDGHQGEDVTESVRTFITNLPFTIPTTNPALKVVGKEFEVRGEVIIKKEDFQLANEALAAAATGNKRTSYANPRNLASGILSRKKHDRHSAPVKLTFVGYSLLSNVEIGSLQA